MRTPTFRNSIWHLTASLGVRRPATLWIAALLCFLGFFAATPTVVWGQGRRSTVEKTAFGLDPEDKAAVVDRDPYDVILVEEGRTKYTFAVKPLALPTPIELKKSGMLQFELLDRQGKILQLPWGLVTQIKTYDDLILEEIRTAYANGNLDLAFRDLIYFRDKKGPRDPLITELLEQFWYRDALELLQSGSNDFALTVLEELYHRNPQFTGSQQPVVELLAEQYNARMQKMAESVEVDRIQAELESLQHRFPVMPPPIAKVVEQWTAAVNRQAQKFLDQAEAASQGDDLIAAHELARRAIHKLPDDPRSWTIYNRVVDRFPAIIVGVTEVPTRPNIRAADNWAARRVGSLLQRQLVDLVGLGEDGGRYEFADGRIMPTDEFGLTYRLEILPKTESGHPTMSSFELADRLSSLVRDGSPEFYFPLAKIVQSISIVDHSKVEIRLRQPFARFESLLRVPYGTSTSDRGVYSLVQSDERLQMYQRANPESAVGHHAVVELRFPNTTQAANALITGEVDVLDRVFPADLPRLENASNVALRPYVIPSIHVLIPNPRNEYMKDVSYRKSFLYSVDREKLLKEVICGGKLRPGFQVISGPLPTGSDENDAIGYGYNDRVANIKFNPGMGIVSPKTVQSRLTAQARKNLIETRANELDGKTEDEINQTLNAWIAADTSLLEPKVIVAHPATDIATAACQAMQQMWRATGRDVELRALPPGVTIPPDNDYDLLYAELTVEEPLVDMRRVLGELGVVKKISPTLEFLLSELDTPRNWIQARQILRQIHELSTSTATVLPLWQTSNYFAFRRNLRGLGDSQVRLYDNVQRWSLERRTKD